MTLLELIFFPPYLPLDLFKVVQRQVSLHGLVRILIFSLVLVMFSMLVVTRRCSFLHYPLGMWSYGFRRPVKKPGTVIFFGRMMTDYFVTPADFLVGFLLGFLVEVFVTSFLVFFAPAHIILNLHFCIHNIFHKKIYILL